MKLKEVDYVDIYHRWLNSCNYFECFLRTGVFVSMKHFPDFELQDIIINKDKTYSKISDIVLECKTKETIFLIDIPGVQAIEQGYLLNNYSNIKPVLAFNFLLHEFGIIGSKKFVNTLVQCGGGLKNIIPESYAFILDYERYQDFTEEQLKSSFNNQYEIVEENLPSAEMLKELGYKKVYYFCECKVKEDICCYLKYLEAHGLQIIKIFLEGE